MSKQHKTRPMSETRAKIIQYLKTFKRPSDIAKAMNISAPAVHRHLEAIRRQNDEAIKRDLPAHRVPEIENFPPKRVYRQQAAGKTRAEVARLLLTFTNSNDIATALGVSTNIVNRHIAALRKQDERMLQRKMVEQRIMTLPSEGY